MDYRLGRGQKGLFVKKVPGVLIGIALLQIGHHPVFVTELELLRSDWGVNRKRTTRSIKLHSPHSQALADAGWLSETSELVPGWRTVNDRSSTITPCSSTACPSIPLSSSSNLSPFSHAALCSLFRIGCEPQTLGYCSGLLGFFYEDF